MNSANRVASRVTPPAWLAPENCLFECLAQQSASKLLSSSLMHIVGKRFMFHTPDAFRA
jgi:hypothetical protein